MPGDCGGGLVAFRRLEEIIKDNSGDIRMYGGLAQSFLQVAFVVIMLTEPAGADRRPDNLLTVFKFFRLSVFIGVTLLLLTLTLGPSGSHSCY